MMAITHGVIAAAGASLILGTAEPLPLALAVLSSQLPDIDTSESIVGQILSPVSHWIEERYAHRTLTHSLLATAAIALVSLSLSYVLGGGWLMGAAAPLGHLLACLSDACTVQGVQLFWPRPIWCVAGKNPKRRLTTGGPSEYWVLAGATALLIAGIWIAGGGGMLPKVSQSLGLRDSAIATYNQHAATNHVYAQVQGVRASDRRDVSGKYLVLGTAGSEFILLDEQQKVLKTGEQIIPSKLSTQVGEAASSQVHQVSFNDEPATPKPQRFGDGLIFVSGELQIDLPEDLELPVQTDQFQTATLTGATLTLTYCPLSEALELLRGQYAIGSLSVRVVRPPPVF